MHANDANNKIKFMGGKIIYPKESYEITGLCFLAQKELGRFCRERQYADFLEGLFVKKGIFYQREVEIKTINDISPKGNIADFIIMNKIILDCKAKKYITKDDYIQMQRYLKAADLKLGMIVNFRSPYLKPKRVINNEKHEY